MMAVPNGNEITQSAPQTSLEDLLTKDAMVIPSEWRKTENDVNENQNNVRSSILVKSKGNKRQVLRLSVIIGISFAAICNMLRWKTQKPKISPRITEGREIMAATVEREEDSISAAISFCKRSFM